MGIISKLFNLGVKAEGSGEPVQTQTDTPIQTHNTSYSGDAFMIVEDVFTIAGRGTVVTGRIISGDIRIGDEIKINGVTPSRIDGIEMFRKTLDYATVGDNVGLLLNGITKDMINRGDALSK